VFLLFGTITGNSKKYLSAQAVKLRWNEEIDICPDAVYLKITSKKPEDLFPMLREMVIQHV